MRYLDCNSAVFIAVFSFANCFLEKTGRDVYPCPAGSPVADCTRAMTSDAYIVYVEMFTQTQSVCFYLEAEAWQARSEVTILRLTDSSEVVSAQMENASLLQVE